jgi:hypothetical protein
MRLVAYGFKKCLETTRHRFRLCEVSGYALAAPQPGANFTLDGRE